MEESEVRTQALLADAKEEMMRGELKLWLKELIHVAFDIEDEQASRSCVWNLWIHSQHSNKCFMGRHNLATRIQDNNDQIKENMLRPYEGPWKPGN